MREILKRLTIGALVVSLLLPLGSMMAFADEDADTADTTQTEETTETEPVDNTPVDPAGAVTEAERIAQMEKVAENQKYIMYADLTDSEYMGQFAVYVKENGKYWWSTPYTDDPNANQSNNDILRSEMVLQYGDQVQRTVVTAYSKHASEKKAEKIEDGFRISYSFKTTYKLPNESGKGGTQRQEERQIFTIPLEFKLSDLGIEATIVAEDIEEFDLSAETGKLAVEIELLPSMGAAKTTEEGYMILPDGSGTLVYYNNGKTNAKPYSAKVYGPNKAISPRSKLYTDEQIYFPMYGMVREDSALLAIATEGDALAKLNCYTGQQEKRQYDYSSTYFSFRYREVDTFSMGSDSTAQEVQMYQSGEINRTNSTVTYIPMVGEGLDYVDVANEYRNYLIEEQGVTPKTENSQSPFFMDFYGGVVRQKSILGIPIKVKAALTTFDQATEITKELKALGVDDMIVGYEGWTNDLINRAISDSVSPASVLGGKSDFNKMTEYFSENGITFIPKSEVMNFYKSANGYGRMNSAVVGVNRSYATQYKYSLPYGRYETWITRPWYLVTPQKLTKAVSKVTSAYEKAGLQGINLMSASSALYADYGKRLTHLTQTEEYLKQAYQEASEKLDIIVADSANAYLLPYVDYIQDLPTTSSGYDIFDKDIPFAQIVLHGLIPYSTKAVNGQSDNGKMVLQAFEMGSNISYDFMYADAKYIKETVYDNKFYAKYDGWIEEASEQYKALKPVLEKVKNATITGHEDLGSGIVRTTYSNGTIVEVNYSFGSVYCDGESIPLDVHVVN